MTNDQTNIPNKQSTRERQHLTTPHLVVKLITALELITLELITNTFCMQYHFATSFPKFITFLAFISVGNFANIALVPCMASKYTLTV